jgi:hypothetical protein
VFVSAAPTRGRPKGVAVPAVVLQNDPWGAARYYAEAEKQEELAENTATELNVSKRQLQQHSC